MDPITIGILGSAVVGGIAQFMNSQQARGANQDEMKSLQQLVSKIQAPNFDPTTLTPQDYKVVGKYVPQVAPHIQEMNPTTITKSPQIAAGQGAQRAALQQLQGIAASPNNPELAGMTRQALDQGQAAAQSRQSSLMDQYQRQGMLNSGVQLAGQLSAGEGAMGQAANSGNQAAMEAYRQRLNALSGSASLGGQMVAQDAGIQGQNAGIINAFNQRAAMSGQNYADYAAQQQNQAQQYNMGQAQGAANLNTGTANQFAQEQQARGDRLKQMQFQNQWAPVSAQMGLGQMGMNQRTQGAQDQNSAIQGVTNGVIGAFGTQGTINAGGQQRRAADSLIKQGQRTQGNMGYGIPPASTPNNPTDASNSSYNYLKPTGEDEEYA